MENKIEIIVGGRNHSKSNEVYDWRFDERLIKYDPKILQAILDAGLTPFVPSVPRLPLDIDHIEVTD